MLIVLGGSNTIRDLEWGAYNTAVWITPDRRPNPQVVVVTVDDASIKMLGRWPWTRDELTTITRKLDNAGATVIGYTLPFDEPQNQLALSALSNYRDNEVDKDTLRLLNLVLLQLNTDRTLAHTFNRTGNVLLSVPYTALTSRPARPSKLPTIMQPHVIEELLYQKGQHNWFAEFFRPSRTIKVDDIIAPVGVIGQAVRGIGLGVGQPSLDGLNATRPLIGLHGDHYLPSFALQATRWSNEYRQKKFAVTFKDGILLDGKALITDKQFRAYPMFYKWKNDQPPFPTYSFADVFTDRVPPDAFQGKIVLIGATIARLEAPVKTPIASPMAPVFLEANTISALLNGDLYSVPSWATPGRYLAFVIVCLYLMLILPRLSLSTGLAISSLLLVVLLNVHFIEMTIYATWFPLMGPIVALIGGHLLLTAKHLVEARVVRYRQELSNSNKLLGQSYQLQAQLDLAFEKYRICDPSDELFGLLYNLGLDYERKRQFNKAINVYKHIQEYQAKYRDIEERIKTNLNTSNTVVLGTGGQRNATNHSLVAGEGVQKPMLGRYQIESELGRGAMGMVYLGTDPKIGRTVAIKTMALSDEFDAAHLEDVKQRFFREAKTAGRLNHPNIVTIYDIGEEHDLAYIAMDFLQGKDMANFTKRTELLPIPEVINVIIQVANALDYAHKQKIVHRDIKPANIIYDRRAKKPSVTDFGIAHLTDTSRTKTGTILGTPSFMSPEQLSGKKVDGRSDLFALGVTLYQLLTASLPFTGDSISALMYCITNDPPRDILKLRPGLPICLKQVIEKSLAKAPEDRFQTGQEIAVALRKCMQSLSTLPNRNKDMGEAPHETLQRRSNDS
ncbi:MAG: CHASE2 domain-containing protein [Gammaproteobacteria bacterium]|nr:CHASE2 domain-containing protein [Gammaproteobacteria bacterium]